MTLSEKFQQEFSGIVNEFNENFEEVNKNFKNVQNKLDEQDINSVNHERELESHRKIHNLLLTITIGTTIAFLVIFILLAIDYLKFTSENRQRLYDKLEQLENKNDSLKINQIINSRLDKFDDKLQTPQDTIH